MSILNPDGSARNGAWKAGPGRSAILTCADESPHLLLKDGLRICSIHLKSC